MALVGAPRPALRDAATWAQARWLAATAVIGGASARVAVGLPSWAWLTGTMLALGGAALWLFPILTLSGLVVVKEVMPRNSAVMVLSISLGLVAMARGAWRHVPPVPAVFFAGFVLVAVASIDTTLAPWESIQTFYLPGTDWEVFPIRSYEILAGLALVGIGGLSLVVGLVVRHREHLERFLIALAAGASVPILMGLKDRATGNVRFHDGAPSIAAGFGHPNAYAVYLVAVVPLLVAFAFTTRNEWIRRGMLLLGALGAVCLLLTFTRSAWIAIVVGCLLAGLLAGKVRHVAALAALAVVLGLATGTAGQVTERFSDVKLTTTVTGDPGDSWQWRLVTWTRMLEVYPENALSGFGFGAYPRRTVEVFGMYGGQINTNLQPDWRRGFGAHNDFVSTVLETGYLGLTLWTGFMLSLFGTAVVLWRRYREPLALGCVVASFGLIFMSASDNVMGYDYSWFLVAAVTTACWIVFRREAADRAEERDAVTVA